MELTDGDSIKSPDGPRLNPDMDVEKIKEKLKRTSSGENPYSFASKGQFRNNSNLVNNHQISSTMDTFRKSEEEESQFISHVYTNKYQNYFPEVNIL